MIFFKIPEQIFACVPCSCYRDPIYIWLIRFCFAALKFGKFPLFWWIHHKGWEAGIPSFKDRYTNVSTNYLFFLQIFQVFENVSIVCIWFQFGFFINIFSTLNFCRYDETQKKMLGQYLSLILQSLSKL